MTTTSNENILMMFEEINQKLNRTNLQIEKIGQEQPEASNGDEISELKSVIETFHESQSEKLNHIENLIQKEKRKIEITPTSTYGMAVFLSMFVMIVALFVGIYSLRNQNATLSDNDLKFRYIQMIGHATAKDFEKLDALFYFDRNSKKIKILRKQVEMFEENVRERAKILEREERLKKKREILELKIRKPKNEQYQKVAEYILPKQA